MIPGRKYTPGDLLQRLWRRRWLVIVPFLIVAAGTLAGIQFLPDRYRSETLILVVPQRVPESYVKATVTARIEDRLNSISQQILSRSRLERIVEDFQLYRDDRQRLPMEDVIERMRRDIAVQMVKGDAFRVSYVSDSPPVAMRVAERLASLFIEENLRDREVLAEATNQFLETQLADARARLVEHEKRLEEYRREHSGELPSQVASNIQAAQNMQMQLQTLTDSISRDRDRLQAAQRALAAAPARQGAAAAVPMDAAAAQGVSPAAQLQAARATLAALRLRLRPEHPDVQRLERTIDSLETKAAAEPAAGPTAAPATEPEDDATAALRDEVASLTALVAEKERRQRRLETQIARYQARLEALPTRESELVALTRDYETLRTVYQDLLSKNEESKVAANLERRQIGEQFKILDPPRLPERPFSPDRPLLAALGAAAGLGLGLLLIVLLEYRDTALHCEEDVLATLDVPVLAMVPVLQTAGSERRRRAVRLMARVATAAGFVALGALAWRVLA